MIERIGQIAGPDAIYTAGVGQHQMWAAQFIPYEKPRTWLNSGGLGTMGYAVPAAMGAKMARPDTHGVGHRRRRLLPDDQPGAGHLRHRGHPDQGRRDQQRQPRHGPAVADPVLRRALLQTDLGTHKHRIPDFVLLAEAMGCVGLRCESKEDVDEVIEQAMAINDRPVVIDFVVGADAQVWPMVAAGTGNDQIMAARGIRPLFDADEIVADDAGDGAMTAEMTEGKK